MLPPQRKVVLALGQTGSGKTHLAKHYAKDLRRLIILDSADLNEFDAVRVESIAELREYLAISNKNGHGIFRVSYCPRNDAEIAEMFQLAVDVNFSEVEGKYVNQSWLLLEEADLIPRPEELPEFDEVISRGRHYGINIIAISLYPAKLSARLRRQATEIFAFRTIEGADIDWFKDLLGSKAQELSTLEPYHYLHWDVGQTEKNVLDR